MLSGERPITGWIHRDTPLTDELKQRMVLFYDLVEQFKHLAHARFINIYFTAREQINVGTDPPGERLWGLHAPADFDQNAEPWGRLGFIEDNPKRETVWTAAGPDPVYSRLTIDAATPIDANGRHIGTLYNELYADEVVAKLQRPDIAMAKYSIFEADGALIAHTDLMNAILRSGGRLRIQDVADEKLRVLWRIVQQRPALPFVGHDAATDQYFAVARTEGPGWYLAATLPGSAIRDKAFAAAQWVLWVGLLSLALVLALLTVALQRGIARPLRALTAAAERIASGDVPHPIRLAKAKELTRLGRPSTT